MKPSIHMEYMHLQVPVLLLSTSSVQTARLRRCMLHLWFQTSTCVPGGLRLVLTNSALLTSEHEACDRLDICYLIKPANQKLLSLKSGPWGDYPMVVSVTCKLGDAHNTLHP